MRRKLLMTVVAAILGLAMAPSFSAGQVTASAADDDIPGVPLPMPPRVITDSLQAQSNETTVVLSGTDIDDVYSLSMKAGQTFWAVLDGEKGTDFDLLLFGANATSVAGETPGLGKSENAGTSFEYLQSTSGKDQIAYLDAYAFDGSGAYALEYGFGTREATVSVAASSTTTYGGPSRIFGQVLAKANGAAIEGMKVYLLEKAYGASTFRKVASTAADADGEYSFEIRPTKTTQYRVMAFGYGSYFVDTQPAAVKVTPTAYITTPSVASPMRPYRTYSVSGFLKPYDSAHTRAVKVRAYKWNAATRSWDWKKTVIATTSRYDSSTARYKGYLSLPRGYWRIRAYADAPYSGTRLYTSNWAPASRYRTIK